MVRWNVTDRRERVYVHLAVLARIIGPGVREDLTMKLLDLRLA